MARRTWKDRVVEFPRRFKDQHGNILELTPFPGTVLEAGTPVNAANLNGLEEDLESHKADKANPHGVTKAQVGLGSVVDGGMATKAQAEAGTATNVYMNPLRAKEAINAFAVPSSDLVPVAGNNFIDVDSGYSNTSTEFSTKAESYFEIRETVVKFYAIKTGTIRLRFGLRSSSSATAYARIYKNGVAVGTIRSTSQTTSVWFSEDFSVTAGDVFSVYGYTSSPTGTAYIKGLRVGTQNQALMVAGSANKFSDPSYQ